MKRVILCISLLLLLLLTSCASTSKKPTPLALQVVSVTDTSLMRLSVTKNDLEEAGYRFGDRVLLELDGFVIRALISNTPLEGSTTLVVAEKGSDLYIPKAINSTSSGLLIPYRDQVGTTQSSLSFSGNFVFTL